jgi:hypothetical protein
VKFKSLQLLTSIAIMALTSCAPPESNEPPPILLFNGSGTSPNDVKAVEAIPNGIPNYRNSIRERLLISTKLAQLRPDCTFPLPDQEACP